MSHFDKPFEQSDIGGLASARVSSSLWGVVLVLALLVNALVSRSRFRSCG